MEQAIIKAACAIGAGLCMGIGAIGPAMGEGNAVGKALEGMAYQHDHRLRHYGNYGYLLSAHRLFDSLCPVSASSGR